MFVLNLSPGGRNKYLEVVQIDVIRNCDVFDTIQKLYPSSSSLFSNSHKLEVEIT